MVTRPPVTLVAGEMVKDRGDILCLAVAAATMVQSGVVALTVFVDEIATVVGVTITEVNDPEASGRTFPTTLPTYEMSTLVQSLFRREVPANPEPVTVILLPLPLSAVSNEMERFLTLHGAQPDLSASSMTLVPHFPYG